MMIYIFSGLVVVIASLFGRGPEKMGALILAPMTLLSGLDHLTSNATFLGLTLCTWENAIGFAGFMVISLRAWRIWPLWCASTQLIALFSAFAKALGLLVTPAALCEIQDVSLVFTAVILVLGTYAIWRGGRRYAGVNWHDWVGSL